MDILSLRLFQRVAELGAVTAAARDLSLSPASASARLAKLEETLGFRLFNRTTRAVSLTTDGAAFLPYIRETIETLEAGLDAISGQGMQAKGLLRMTMPGSFGRMHVIPALAAFRERHPLVRLDIRLSDEVLDVVEGAYDLIIRNAPLEDSSMVARKLAGDRRLLLAAPEYLARKGVPTHPVDLVDHDCVILARGDRWRFADGQVVAVPRTWVVNDGEAMRSMMEAGLGIGIASQWIASKQIEQGQLVEVLPQQPLLTRSAIWALHSSGQMVAPKVRAMIDFLWDRFNPVPPWKVGPQKV